MFCGNTTEHPPHPECAGFSDTQSQDNSRAVFCHRKDGGVLIYLDDEYNGLSGGGDYEIWDCTVHGKHYFELPD